MNLQTDEGDPEKKWLYGKPFKKRDDHDQQFIESDQPSPTENIGIENETNVGSMTMSNYFNDPGLVAKSIKQDQSSFQVPYIPEQIGIDPGAHGMGAFEEHNVVLPNPYPNDGVVHHPHGNEPIVPVQNALQEAMENFARDVFYV